MVLRAAFTSVGPRNMRKQGDAHQKLKHTSPGYADGLRRADRCRQDLPRECLDIHTITAHPCQFVDVPRCPEKAGQPQKFLDSLEV